MKILAIRHNSGTGQEEDAEVDLSYSLGYMLFSAGGTTFKIVPHELWAAWDKVRPLQRAS
jgi:hypothetical protein